MPIAGDGQRAHQNSPRLRWGRTCSTVSVLSFRIKLRLLYPANWVRGEASKRFHNAARVETALDVSLKNLQQGLGWVSNSRCCGSFAHSGVVYTSQEEGSFPCLARRDVSKAARGRGLLGGCRGWSWWDRKSWPSCLQHRNSHRPRLPRHGGLEHPILQIVWQAV